MGSRYKNYGRRDRFMSREDQNTRGRDLTRLVEAGEKPQARFFKSFWVMLTDESGSEPGTYSARRLLDDADSATNPEIDYINNVIVRDRPSLKTETSSGDGTRVLIVSQHVDANGDPIFIGLSPGDIVHNAEITGESSGGGKYSAKLLEFDGSGSLVDASPAVTWTETIIEVNGRQGIPTGTRIEMTLIGTDGSGNEWFSFANIDVATMFAVNLTKDGGTDGDSTTQASYTYTAKSLNDAVTYGTSLTPKKQRPAVGTVTSGDGLIGLGYFDDAGNFQLYDANEVKTWEVCS